jgi:hypothetical protein
MNTGKRYLRNTLFALYGGVALFIGLNKLYGSMVAADAPGVSRTTWLGLTAHARPQPRPTLSDADLASLRAFTRLNIEGDFVVEIVGADAYKVTFTAADGRSGKLRAWQGDEVLRLEAAAESSGTGVLRIETPQIRSIFVQDARQLTLRGLRADSVNIVAINVAAARLQQNQVAHWKFHSSTPLEALVDKATLSAGSIQTTGNLAIRYGE